MGFCLPKENTEKFLNALKDGKIVPEDLIQMSSEQRRAFLEPIVGKENIHEVNGLLESKLILKDQKKGMVAWAKKVANISEARRADLIAKIERLDHVLDEADQQAFLEDLVATKLGTAVSLDEAHIIADLSKKIATSREGWNGKEWTDKTAQFEYGASKIALENYVGELKLSNEKMTLGGIAKDLRDDPVEATKKGISELAGISKGIKASLDDSAIFRQGWKTLFTHPGTWAKNAVQSFRDIATQLTRKPSNADVINGIKAEIQSRNNALNGNYDRLKIDIGTGEEAFPTSLPERIPVLGRVYKASETAYTGFLYRMRADIADKYIQIAENNGVNIKDPVQARSIGKLVNSLTGRGDLGSLEKIGKQVNTIFFSPKMLKANFDFLTGHNLQKGVSPFVRKQAAINILKVAAGTAVIMATARAVLGDDSVELDPRSSDFGKIRVGDTRFDISGGMASIVTLASRLLPTEGDEGLGLYTKNATTHKVNKLNAKTKDGKPKFGAQTGMDVAFDFATNKASPAASVLVDLLRGSTFEGKQPTVLGEAGNAFLPLPFTNAQELLASDTGADPLIGIIADSLGISTNTYSAKKK